MGKIVIHDTADVTITDLNTGKVVLNAEAQLAQISGAISEEDLKGGIGNRKLYKIRTDKEVNLTMRSAVADVDYWAMTQGVAVDEAGVALVTTKLEGEVVQDTTTSSNEIVLPELVAGRVGDKVVVGDFARIDINGVQETIPVVVSLTDPTKFALDLSGATATPTVGDTVTVFYQKEVEGKQIKIDSNKFAGKYKVEMKTIAYDLDTATVKSDIYFLFYETIPAGEFDISLENGSVYTPEISFSVMNPTITTGVDNSEMGQIIEVAR